MTMRIHLAYRSARPTRSTHSAAHMEIQRRLRAHSIHLGSETTELGRA